ncbi:hypothetical protein NUU61_002423 [Penicillium alfredii]|uniref:Uncharacterized protein n=1 Tax=Penicillium alfredii TaxID=1506179 RepID=A0A9W9KGL4_9EURO|nr:uncharacterized protein NUU61_002423 [Penicillium alfredii]KAJ5105076.1 hypothetical protein NUU61_002423 [Penicillium alfredii]
MSTWNEANQRNATGDGNKPQCHRCERSGSSCVWQAVPSGFRHGSSARYDADFADDQPWVPVGHAEFQYVDETADIARHYSVDLGSSPLASGRRRSVSFTDHRTLTDPSVLTLGQFDICDGERHFECTVPLRARSCPPLLYAIYTAAARHLSRIKKYYIGNQIQYGGKILPNLTPETALHYHNQCIAHFVSLSDHSREAQDENLLAAAVILRFYEEVDCSLRVQ